MRARVILVMIFLLTSSLIIVGTADDGDEPFSISITFNFSDANTLSSVNQASVTVIEGWTGTILGTHIINDGDSLSVIANHSIRFEVDATGYATWMNIAIPYSEDTAVSVNLANSSDAHLGITTEQNNLTGGGVTLEFPHQLVSGVTIQLNWTAEYSFSTHYGIELMPNASDGLPTQIDIWLGDDDGTLSLDEKSLFIDWMETQSWSDAYFGGCCILDGNEPITQSPVIPMGAWIAADDSEWGWNESGVLQVNTGFTSTRLLQIPLQNDVRQSIPLRVLLPNDWEFRYSPDSDLISGLPVDFEVLRNSSGSGGYLLPITLAENTPPSAIGEIDSHRGQSLPLITNVTFDASSSTDSSHNVGLGPTLECGWTFIGSSITLVVHEEIAIVNLSENGYVAGESLETVLTCTDFQGLSDSWNYSWYIDGTSPTAIELTGTLTCLDDTEQVDLLQCEELAAPSSTIMSLRLNVSDDGPAEPLVDWTSNHIDGWSSTGSTTDVVFWQGQNTNINYLAYGTHHEQRELAVWVLQMQVTDEAGNGLEKSWNVTVLDGTAPRIDVVLLNASNGFPLNSLQALRVGMGLAINLNDSFDDIHSIDDVHFTVHADGELLADSSETGWEGVRTITLPMFGVGLHELVINATDGAGNTVEDIIQILIEPALGIDISSVEVQPITASEPGPVTLNFTFVNSAATPYNATICIAEQCYIKSGSGATFENEGVMYGEFEFTLPISKEIEINYSFTGGGYQESFTLTHDIEISDDGGTVKTFTGLIATVAVLGMAAWIYRRS